MIRVLIPVLILAVAVVVIAARRGGGLVRGMAGDMLVSPARPAVGVLPASLFHLEQACRLEGSPPSADGPLSAPARADFWYALYDAEAPETSGPASLVALLGVTESPYRWIAGNGAPGAAGEAGTERRLRRESRDIMDGRTVFTVTFLVPSAADPWPRAGAAWQEGSLARRLTFPLFQDKARLVVEYREPYGPLLAAARRRGIPLADDAATLAAFEARAAEAFRLVTADVPRPDASPPYPPAGVERKRIAAYAGEVWRAEGNR